MNMIGMLFLFYLFFYWQMLSMGANIGQAVAQTLQANAYDLIALDVKTTRRYPASGTRVKSDKFGHQVNLDTHLQTVEIQTRRLFIAVSSGFSLFA